MSCVERIAVKSGPKGGRKLPNTGLLNSASNHIYNVYIPGSGVGASSVSARRLKNRIAAIELNCPFIDVIAKYILNAYGLSSSQTLIVDINSDTSVVENTLAKLNINTGFTSLVIYSTTEDDIDTLIAEYNFPQYISEVPTTEVPVTEVPVTTEKREIRLLNNSFYTLVYQFQNYIE